MAELAEAIVELAAHIQVLWEHVARNIYDPRSIVGDNCLSLHEHMANRVNDMLPRYETDVALAGQLAYLLPSLKAIQKVAESKHYDGEAGKLLEDWVIGADEIFSRIRELLNADQLALLEKAEERQRNRAKG